MTARRRSKRRKKIATGSASVMAAAAMTAGVAFGGAQATVNPVVSFPPNPPVVSFPSNPPVVSFPHPSEITFAYESRVLTAMLRALNEVGVTIDDRGGIQIVSQGVLGGTVLNHPDAQGDGGASFAFLPGSVAGASSSSAGDVAFALAVLGLGVATASADDTGSVTCFGARDSDLVLGWCVHKRSGRIRLSLRPAEEGDPVRPDESRDAPHRRPVAGGHPRRRGARGGRQRDSVDEGLRSGHPRSVGRNPPDRGHLELWVRTRHRRRQRFECRRPGVWAGSDHTGLAGKHDRSLPRRDRGR